MRRSPLLLGISLLANALLLALMPSTESQTGYQGNSRASVNDFIEKPSTVAAEGRQPSGAGTIKLWDVLNTEDFRELVMRLRAAGFPEKVIRGLITRKVDARFANRLSDMRGRNSDLPYWQRSRPVPDPKRDAESMKAWNERNQLITDLVGKSDDPDQGYGMWELARLDFLPPEKIKGMSDIQRTLAESYKKQFERPLKPGEKPSKEVQGKLDGLRQQQNDDFAKLLTPTELSEYNLRTSIAASILIDDLETFRPTEAEYRALFPVYESGFEDLKKATGPETQSLGPDPAKALRLAKLAQIQVVLGADRYADFIQATEPGATKLNMITERLGLPLSAAAEVTSVEKGITQRVQDIQKNAALTSEQKSQQITALSTEAEVAITTVLGSDGFGAYKQYSGAWLAKLQGSKK